MKTLDEDLTKSTYCYVSPNPIWKGDFDLNSDVFERYNKRVHASYRLFKNVLKRRIVLKDEKKQLNYRID